MLSITLNVIKSNIIRPNTYQTLLNSKQLYKNLFTFTLKETQFNSSLFSDKLNEKYLKNISLSFSSKQITKSGDPDVFGDLSGDQYETMELNDDEKELEEFEKHETKLPRRLRLSPGRYARLISDHIAKGDLYSAINVLELVKKNRDKPTTYMYNLLLRGYAVQGKLEKCFKLYNDMKKRALKQNAATYTSIFNACANTTDKERALEILTNVRHELLQKNFPLNSVHYNVMIKAYGKHKYLLEAFQLVDEMIDKRLPTNETTFNSLLYAAIDDKDNGLRHSLVVWHLMQQRRIKPSILTYNLLLRAIRETKLGNLEVNDLLVKELPTTQILLTDNGNPDLLARPPVVTSFVISSFAPPAIVKNDNELIKYKSSSAPNEIVSSEIQNTEPIVHSKIRLNTIYEKNRLILFGGYTGFIERMEKDNVTPDRKTITLLLDVIPDSLSIENELIQIARIKKIQLDIDFFNMLIKKRSSRRDYKNALAVLDEVQLHGLIPDIVTWGVLAMGCQTRDQGHTLIEGMNATGHTLNIIIATTLIHNACEQNNFLYILDIFEIMSKNRVKPSEITYKILDEFQQKISKIVCGKVKSKHTKNPRFKEIYFKFNLRYDSLQRQFGREKSRTKTYRDTKTNRQ